MGTNGKYGYRMHNRTSLMHALEVKCVKDKGYLLNFNLKIWLLSIFLNLQLKGRLLLKLIIVLIILWLYFICSTWKNLIVLLPKKLLIKLFFCRFACMDPASLTIVPDIKLPTVDGRQLSPENCVSSNKEVRGTWRLWNPPVNHLTLVSELVSTYN